jgi:CubicO group peptidase (beta-lactamase class C family)
VKVALALLAVAAACLVAPRSRVEVRSLDPVEADRPAAFEPSPWFGSDTSVFTATMVVRLAEAGRLSLDDRVGDLLPWYRQDTGQRLKVRHLLNHTSGLPDHANEIGPDHHARVGGKSSAVVQRWCSGDLLWEPGARWAHSRADYMVLGAIIEEVTGKSYARAAQELVFAPPARNREAFGQGPSAQKAASPEGSGRVVGTEIPSRTTP